MGESEGEAMEGSVVVDVGEELTIGRVIELKQQILAALAESENVVLQLADVSAVDAVGIQLLWSAHRSATEGGRRLILEGASSAILEEAAALGVPSLPEPGELVEDGARP